MDNNMNKKHPSNTPGKENTKHKNIQKASFFKNKLDAFKF